jgi:hypothetical protein
MGATVQAIGLVIPIAIAVAISSVPIMTTLFILMSPNRSRAAVPFLVGWVVGIFLVVSLCALLAQAIPEPRSSRQPDTAVAVLQILVGAALIVIAIVSWRRERHGGSTAPTPSWLSSAGNLGPWSATGLGLLLNIRPKGLLLAIAAGLTVRADADTLATAIIAIVIYTLIAASTVAVPIIATLMSPTRMEPRLVAANDWMLRNGARLTSAIIGLIGLVIVVMGIARL